MDETGNAPRGAHDDDTVALDLRRSIEWAREGIKYAGSKQKLLEPIYRSVAAVPHNSVLDLFSGTTRVSRLFAGMGSRVLSSDISVWSQCFATAYLLNEHPARHYRQLIDHLNAVKPVDGWFTCNYGGVDNCGSAVQKDGAKALWQKHNAMKLDGIREEIDRLGLTDVEKAVALTSLVYALDSVENTLGHFASYLKEWSPRSYNTMELTVPALIAQEAGRHRVLRGDAADIARRLRDSGEEFDVAYFDPPYGSNNEKMPPSRVRYASYYHIWKTVILNDRPEVFGAARRRQDSRDRVAASPFEEYRCDERGRPRALDALHEVLRCAPARHILLSYSSGGRATFEQLMGILDSTGSLVSVAQIEYRRNVMANMRWTNDWVPPTDKPNIEYLFLLAKK